MDKIILLVVLATIAICIALAIKGKTLPDFFSELPKPPVNPSKFVVPNGTVVVPDMYMCQLDQDGNTIHAFELNRRMMHDGQDMVGITVSHPGAKSNGIILKPQNRYNQKKDVSMTVNTDAIRIGYDSKGFFGEVSNPNARVYVSKEGKKPVLIKYNSQFEIQDNTYVLIGNQWLQFSFPGLPSIDAFNKGDKSNNPTVNRNDDTAPDLPTFVNRPKKKSMARHSDSNAADADSVDVKSTSDDSFILY